MRSEQEMLDLIISTAQEDERIRAVIMNGSRANPKAPRDIFQDFDIVYVVSEMQPFVRNLAWIQRFGEMMIFQLPDDMTDPPPDPGSHYCYLMQFADGNRIDLSLIPVSKVDEMDEDSLTVVLLDKDNILGEVPPPDEASYLPQPPTAKQFADCCNEFWWVSPYAAKGLWREEIIYAKHMLDEYVREQLDKMLRWHIGLKTGFAANPGKEGKYFQRYLEQELWELLLKTYADASYEHTWEALFAMGDLFRKMAVPIADYYGYEYPLDDDRKVSAHLKHVKKLPRGAKEVY